MEVECSLRDAQDVRVEQFVADNDQVGIKGCAGPRMLQPKDCQGYAELLCLVRPLYAALNHLQAAVREHQRGEQSDDYLGYRLAQAEEVLRSVEAIAR